jgi:manganese/zinc/iron transport system permease protein
MTIGSADLWIVFTGACAGVACAVCGLFLVLRRMSMLGDAISHAVLPGIAGAFLLSGSRAYAPMFAGALGTGVLTALGASWLKRATRLDEETSLGIILSTFFALGVVMITFTARSVDLDPGCVLYGLIEYVPFDTAAIGGWRVPRAVLVLAPTALAVSALAWAALPALRLGAFDPAYAQASRASRGYEYVVLIATAFVTVASFEAVGSILVVAMLVAPGATALLLTDRLGRALVIAAASAVASAVIGYALALFFDSSVAGMMSVVTCMLFALAAVLAPRHGALARWLAHERLAQRIAEEDVLGLLWRRDEGTRVIGAGETVAGLIVQATRGGTRQRRAVRALRASGLVEVSGRARGAGSRTSTTADFSGPGLGAGAQAGVTPDLHLTPAGRARAAALVRGHRLWERYLDTNTALTPDHLHAPSDRAEHFLTPEMRAQLAREAGGAADPHGRAIPEDPDK